MADALASGASVLRDVGVQVPLRPPRAVQLKTLTRVRLQKCRLTFRFSSIDLRMSAKPAIGESVGGVPDLAVSVRNLGRCHRSDRRVTFRLGPFVAVRSDKSSALACHTGDVFVF